jgi:hypothetical protein
MDKRKYRIHLFLKLFQLSFTMICWITQHVSIESPCSVSNYKPLIEKLERVSYRGSNFLFDYVKKLRTSLLLFLLKEYPLKKIKGISLTKDGIPKALGPLIKYTRLESPEVIRLTLTNFILNLEP